MLLLSRKSGEVVLIGDDIVVKVIELKDNTVTLGFAAPKEVAVVRKEIARTGKRNSGVKGGSNNA